MFDYIKQNHIPFRVRVVLEVEHKETIPDNCNIQSGEKLTITETTHIHYPLLVEDNIGFNSTSFGDRNPWPTGVTPTNEETDVPYNPLDETVVGGYGYDYIEKPNNTIYRGPLNPEPYGDSISITEVNGLVNDLIVTTVLIDNTGF